MSSLRRLLVVTAVLLAACDPGGGAREAVQELAADDATEAQTRCILDRLEVEFGIELDALGGELTPEQEQTIAIARDVCLLDPDADSTTPSGDPTGDTLPATLADAPQRFDPTDPPPGDDEELDVLWDACGDGDGQACDELFYAADPGSEYEAFAFSCGGRENLRCTVLLNGEALTGELTSSTPPPGEDRILDPWWERCAAGSATACDQLQLASPGGSIYYQFGATCGGRSNGYCTQLLGNDGTPPILERIHPADPPPGDDDLLDQLWAACGLRNPQACDDLYSIAPYGSLYERYALSCGGRAVAPCATLFLNEDADNVVSSEEEAERGG